MRSISGVLITFFLYASAYAQTSYSWSTFTPQNSQLPDELVTSLAYSSNGIMWIGTASGLASIKDSVIEKDTVFPPYYITCVDVDNNGLVWVGTSGNGCFRRNANGTFTQFNPATTGGALASSDILSLHIDGDSVWVGTNGHGLFLYFNSNWSQYYSANHPLGWPINQVNHIATDAQDRVWFGTAQYGLIRKDVSNQYWKFNADSGLRYNHVRSFALQGDSAVWIGMGNTHGDSALAHLNYQDFTLAQFEESNSDQNIQQNVWDILIDEQNRKWIASNQTDHGLLLYDDTVFTAFNEFTSGILSNRTYALAEDDSGRIWVGSFRGLSVNFVISTLAAPEYPELIASIYPNPSSDFVNIQFAPVGHQTEISVFDLRGIEVFHQVMENPADQIFQYQIPVSGLEKGLYLLRIQNGVLNKTLKVIKL